MYGMGMICNFGCRRVTLDKRVQIPVLRILIRGLLDCTTRALKALSTSSSERRKARRQCGHRLGENMGYFWFALGMRLGLMDTNSKG